ncbi:Uncharacterised protein [Mycobacteroides abscessus subsp. abscessus]|nr:Uncharacterised protein [Mycobacteroides abscessus subsp. abscessus]
MAQRTGRRSGGHRRHGHRIRAHPVTIQPHQQLLPRQLTTRSISGGHLVRLRLHTQRYRHLPWRAQRRTALSRSHVIAPLATTTASRCSPAPAAAAVAPLPVTHPHRHPSGRGRSQQEPIPGPQNQHCNKHAQRRLPPLPLTAGGHQYRPTEQKREHQRTNPDSTRKSQPGPRFRATRGGHCAPPATKSIARHRQ